MWDVLGLRGGICGGIGLDGAVVGGCVESWRLLWCRSGFDGLIIAGRGVMVIGIVIMILVVITVNRRSGRWLYETGVGLLLGEFGSAMQ